ncbi:hypothetical protein [Burkholderia cepacia]|uniref:hypothetical protein n=1 Tax=Burkholderia cepacia TaxID=292 RepID=UPI001F2553AE|nr:hypothetical protein [Burkholderia cepacia]UIY59770.1 hypothetical protein LZ568_32795 [Burkholderia cepacia]
MVSARSARRRLLAAARRSPGPCCRQHAVRVVGFAREFEPEINALAEALADCFGRIPPFREAAARVATRQSALVDGFVLGVLDDLVVSSKLLLAGKVPAAGNVMRQVIEGIAMAAMCVSDELLVIERSKKQGAIRARYWEKVWDDDNRVQGHRAVEQLDWNRDVLRFTAVGVHY